MFLCKEGAGGRGVTMIRTRWNQAPIEKQAMRQTPPHVAHSEVVARAALALQACQGSAPIQSEMLDVIARSEIGHPLSALLHNPLLHPTAPPHPPAVGAPPRAERERG